MKASEIQAGDKVMYCGVIAKVIEVCKNGVRIEYWRQVGSFEPECRRERVAARYLTAA